MADVVTAVIATLTERGADAIKAIERAAAMPSLAHVFVYQNDGSRPLCEIMNLANTGALEVYPDTTHLAKVDDDDWSAPERIAEQLALMERTNACVVGYHTIPFYDVRTGEVFIYSNPNSSYALGTSLLMRREAWEQFNFPDTSKRPGNPRGSGSDTLFVAHWAGKGKMHGVCGIERMPGTEKRFGQPRMIATIHDGNTSVDPARGGFRRADEALARSVREIMEKP